MNYYTNNRIVDLEGTATVQINEDIIGKYSGEVMKKGSKIIVSGLQYKSLMSVIDDGNCVWDVVVDLDTDRDQFQLSYNDSKTNFSLDSLNC